MQPGDLARYCDILGLQERAVPWDQFYMEATKCRETFLVKTHDPPRDDQPVIHIVRDGRLALQSYLLFNRKVHSHHLKTLFDLILGDDRFGDWSKHFFSWAERPSGRYLLIRFEDLVNPSDSLLCNIATFIQYRGPIQKWRNPFDELKRIAPWQYGNGDIEWRPNELWSPKTSWAFWMLHGRLMRALGYATHETVRQETSATPAGMAPYLLSRTAGLLAKMNEMARMCEQKEAVIQELKAECTNRLALIKRIR